MEPTNQKEYLKKYLSGKDGKKKKRKKKEIVGERVKIIDDDIDISQLKTAEEAAELFANNEDAPQVVGIVDERPMHLRTGDYRQTDLWKPVGTEDLIEDGILPIKTPNKISLLLKNHKDSIRHLDPSILYNNAKQKQIDKTITQPTLSRSLSRSSISINLKSSDSTPRRSQDFDNTPLRKPRDDADFSPSRRIKREPESSVRELSPESSVRVLSPDSSPPRKSRWDSDNSPPRKQRRNSDSSPPRRARKNSDSSPPRRTRKTLDYSPLRNRGNSDCNSPKRPKRSYDNSPPRRSRTHSDISPPRTSKADTSPLRRIKRNSESSPLRNAKQGISEKHLNKEPSEPPKRKLLPGNKKGKYLIPAKRNIPSNAKTLEGKVAGLRSKESLIQENEVFRQREDELFKNMPSEVSGANASTIIRDRKTGKIRDLVKEAAELKEKEKLDAENKEKYARWGRGLKQVEAFEDKLVQDIHEMNKPLARYADDEDLEKYLIEQEREGDPMLSYIRKKKKKHVIETKKPVKPQYEGEFMPNRFGIRPGHRWDGVDRSNEYEKKWFDVQNAKQAQQEEIYKWSTEDM